MRKSSMVHFQHNQAVWLILVVFNSRTLHTSHLKEIGILTIFMDFLSVAYMLQVHSLEIPADSEFNGFLSFGS